MQRPGPCGSLKSATRSFRTLPGLLCRTVGVVWSASAGPECCHLRCRWPSALGHYTPDLPVVLLLPFLRDPFIRMDTFTTLFWLSTLLFIGLSAYLACCKKRSNAFYAQIVSGLGIFATSKIGRKFLRLE